MSTVSPINGLPIPDDDSPNDPPIHFQAFSDVIDSRLLARFTSTADRDAKISSPVKGMSCSTDDAGFWDCLTNGTWTARQSGALGIVGHGETTGTSGVIATYSGSEILLGGGLGFTAHLKPGRAYQLAAAIRVWNATSEPVGAIFNARIVTAGTTATASSPLLTGNSMELTINGDHRMPLSLRRTFQVANENDYFISFWGSSNGGGGSITFGVASDGVATADLFDMGPALAGLPVLG